ncbi:MAG: T9SS type A sorting domain-containing protein, partial [Prevotellaceae bacterium]|nr:T9SS type A sorting domain-containing protein [Prevotellaceae bacterium]
MGTKQDYKKAVEYFSKGVVHQQPSSMYFLGLCYMDGSGVPKDIEKGKQLIEQAANLGNDHAAEFITKELIGKYKKPKRVARSKGAGDANPGFRTKAGNTTLNLNGEWTGRILQYDWSKENIKEESNLNLKITDENGKLSGIWLQNDTVSIELNAVQNGSVYETDNMQYMLTWDRTYNIRSLEFTLEIDEKGDSILYAVITQFSPQTVEPSRPTMLERRRSRSLSGAETDTQTATEFRVYPNPFKDQLTVEFTAQQAGEYSILLYDLSGKLIRTEIVPVGNPTASGKRYAVSKTLNTTSLPVGTYSVN